MGKSTSHSNWKLCLFQHCNLPAIQVIMVCVNPTYISQAVQVSLCKRLQHTVKIGFWLWRRLCCSTDAEASFMWKCCASGLQLATVYCVQFVSHCLQFHCSFESSCTVFRDQFIMKVMNWSSTTTSAVCYWLVCQPVQLELYHAFLQHAGSVVHETTYRLSWKSWQIIWFYPFMTPLTPFKVSNQQISCRLHNLSCYRLLTFCCCLCKLLCNPTPHLAPPLHAFSSSSFF